MMNEVPPRWSQLEHSWGRLPRYVRLSIVVSSLLIEAGFITVAGVLGMAFIRAQQIPSSWNYALELQVTSGQARLNLISESKFGVKNCDFEGCPPKGVLISQPLVTVFSQGIEWGGYPIVDHSLNWP